ncbi:MAG: hypothetical protein JNM66_10030 [Bryobacterales bacterium]|nr:hypothetical protein [Bryobacterales bacterium]
MFLDELLDRTIGESQLPAVAPRRASRFEPDAEAPPVEEDLFAEPTDRAPVERQQMPFSARTAVRNEQTDIEHAPVREPAVRSIGPASPQTMRTAPPVNGEAPAKEPPRPEPAAPFILERSVFLSPYPPPDVPEPAVQEAPPRLTETTRIVERTRETETHVLERRFEKLERETRTVRELAQPDWPEAPARAKHREIETDAPRTTPRNGSVAGPPSPVQIRSRLSRSPQAAPAEPAPPPVSVHVNIGRIEVRAAATGSSAPRKTGPNEPRLSLEDYLTRRERG